MYLTMGLLLLFAVSAILIKDTLLSILSLASVSIMLSIIFFQLGAPVAGVFELSVGAGLITVLAVLTISFLQTRRERGVAHTLVWSLIALSAVGVLVVLLFRTSPMIVPSAAVPSTWGQVGEIIWKDRAFDLLPQALVILSAAFGILALLRPGKGAEK